MVLIWAGAFEIQFDALSSELLFVDNDGFVIDTSDNENVKFIVIVDDIKEEVFEFDNCNKEEVVHDGNDDDVDALLVLDDFPFTFVDQYWSKTPFPRILPEQYSCTLLFNCFSSCINQFHSDWVLAYKSSLSFIFDE